MSLRDRIRRIEIALALARSASFREAWRRHVESGGAWWPSGEVLGELQDLRRTLFAMNRATGLEPGTHLGFGPTEEELEELATDVDPPPTA